MSTTTDNKLELIWPQVRRLFAGSLGTLVASINEDGSPHLTPIGSLTLRDDCTGCYLERFPTNLPRNVERDPRISVYTARDGLLTWMWQLMRGRFDKFIAIRLLGTAGERRPLSDAERSRFLRKVRIFSWTRGHDLLWGDMRYARELRFHGYEPIKAGGMTRDL